MGVGLWLLLAQADGAGGGVPLTTLPWVNTLTNLGSFAVLVIFLLYGLPKAYEKITGDREKDQERFVNTIAKMVADFKADSEDQRKLFREQTTAERVACEKRLEAQAATDTANAQAMITAFKTMSDQVQTFVARTVEHDRRGREQAEQLRQALDKIPPAEGKG